VIFAYGQPVVGRNISLLSSSVLRLSQLLR